MGCRSVPKRPPFPLGLRLAECRAGGGSLGVCGGIAKMFAPLSNTRCCDLPPLRPPPLHCRLGLAAVPSSLCGLPPPPTSREGPAHSSMSEPQPGRAQRQGRRGGRAGAGLRHPGRVSSQVPPRAWRGGGRRARMPGPRRAPEAPSLPARRLCGGGKHTPPLPAPGRPSVAAGGAGGPARGKPAVAAPGETAPRSACESGRW